MLTNKEDKLINELNTPVFKDEFWVFLFLALCIFILGMLVGSVAHDSMFHAIEQNLK